ncbi:hypothetical protein ACNJGB_21185, partial [Mycobacterium tuberculosis]
AVLGLDMTSAETALSLTRMALALLDKAGDGPTIAGCHLQAAIDAMTGARPMHEGDELDETT